MYGVLGLYSCGKKMLQVEVTRLLPCTNVEHEFHYIVHQCSKCMHIFQPAPLCASCMYVKVFKTLPTCHSIKLNSDHQSPPQSTLLPSDHAFISFGTSFD